MKFYLIRHGVTDWNKSMRFQGREDIPLNDEGKLQAEMCADYLKTLSPELVVTSPLIRARYTADRIAAACSLPAPEVTEDFIERDFGALSGTAPGLNIFDPSEDTPGLETLDAVSSRFLGGLRKRAMLAEKIAVVSHGGAINAVLRKIAPEYYRDGWVRLHNGSVSTIEFDGSDFHLVELNHTTCD